MSEPDAKTIAAQLRGEPEDAIIEFAEKLRELDIRSGLTVEDSLFVVGFFERFIKKYSIDIDVDVRKEKNVQAQALGIVNSILDQSDKLIFKLNSRLVQSDIIDALDEYEKRNDESFGLAHLNEAEKRRIHEHIARVREIIEASNLPDRKKNALFDRLSALSKEVDQYGTRTDRFFAFMGDIAFVAGDMAKKAKPLIDEVKEMVKIVSRSRARQEGISLPPGDEVLQLPADE